MQIVSNLTVTPLILNSLTVVGQWSLVGGGLTGTVLQSNPNLAGQIFYATLLLNLDQAGGGPLPLNNFLFNVTLVQVSGNVRIYASNPVGKLVQPGDLAAGNTTFMFEYRFQIDANTIAQLRLDCEPISLSGADVAVNINSVSIFPGFP